MSTTTDTEPTDAAAQFDAFEALLDRREARRAKQQRAKQFAEHDERRRRLMGGPCAGCAQVLSTWRDWRPDVAPCEIYGAQCDCTMSVPSWRTTTGGHQLCVQCGDLLGTGNDLADLKASVAHSLMSAEKERFYFLPATVTKLRDVPLLAVECPGTPQRTTLGSTAERFSWIDVARDVYPHLDAVPSPEYRVGNPCPRCGTSDRWVTGPGGQVTVSDGAGKLLDAYEREETWCAACATRPLSPIEASKLPAVPAAPVWLGGPLGALDPLHSNATAR